jgi:hypothetical protein
MGRYVFHVYGGLRVDRRSLVSTFVQRRFVDADEQEYVLQELANMGVDPNGREAAEYYHTEFYLSRPPEEAAKISIEALLQKTASRSNHPES